MRHQWNVHRCRTPLGELHVRAWGDGPATVAWHSAYIDSRSFDRLVAAVPERRWVLIDGPGHGRSAAPDRLFDLDACADCALEVIDALDLGAVDWVGNAWGGHTGAVLAARPDAPLRSFAALCAPMQPPELGLGVRAMQAAFPVVGLRGPLRSGLLGALLDPARRQADPALEALVIDAISRPDRRGLSVALESVVLRRPDLVDRLDRIAVPTLFVTGDNPLWTREQARSQAERVPLGRFAHLAGVRHLPPLEDPQGTAGLLRSLWADR